MIVRSRKTEYHDGGASRVVSRFKELRLYWRSCSSHPSPKLFHNLRASRESELMREYDLATVCKWIGNSPVVAGKHYA
jgi:hypothetical protein